LDTFLFRESVVPFFCFFFGHWFYRLKVERARPAFVLRAAIVTDDGMGLGGIGAGCATLFAANLTAVNLLTINEHALAGRAFGFNFRGNCHGRKDRG
jgi:hypothetical protein